MARINIEDSLFNDGRFIALATKHGIKTASGIMLCAFRLAQVYWLKGKCLIPENEFMFDPDFVDVLSVGLAEKTPDGVYIKGTAEQFNWAYIRAENGKKGGRPKNNLNAQKGDLGSKKGKKEGSKETEKNLNVTKVEPKGNLNEPKHNPLTPSLTLSPTQSHTQEELNLAEASKKQTEEISARGVAPTAAAWDSYEKSFEEVYKIKPARNGRVNGMLANLIKRIPAEAAPDVIRFYLGHKDFFYVKKMHPVSLLLQDAEKLYAEWRSGKKITTTDAKQAEMVDHATDQLRRIQNGEL